MAAANPHEELKRFIQSAGRREALNKLQGFEFLIKKEDSVAFGIQPGIQPILRIARQPDSLFAAFESSSQNNAAQLIQRSAKSHASHSWQITTQRAAVFIHQAATNFSESAEAAPTGPRRPDPPPDRTGSRSRRRHLPAHRHRPQRHRKRRRPEHPWPR